MKINYSSSGIVYLPQEKPLNDKDISNIYKLLKSEIRAGKEKDQNIMLAGDFNCKVGEEHIEGSLGLPSKGGKKLIKMIEQEKMLLANACNECKGLWTWEEKGKKSVIDYILGDRK